MTGPYLTDHIAYRPGRDPQAARLRLPPWFCATCLVTANVRAEWPCVAAWQQLNHQPFGAVKDLLRRSQHECAKDLRVSEQSLYRRFVGGMVVPHGTQTLPLVRPRCPGAVERSNGSGASGRSAAPARRPP